MQTSAQVPAAPAPPNQTGSPTSNPAAPAPPTATSATKNSSPSSPLKNILLIFLIALIAFSVGIGGVYAYFTIFSDSTPPPPAPRSTTLGAKAQAPSPSPSPAPNLTPQPEVVDQPLSGTLAYIQDNQIYTIKADRTLPDQITSDDTIKKELASTPNGESLVYTFNDIKPDQKGTGLALVNRTTKKITTLLEPAENILQQPRISPNNEYVSIWVDQGKESWIVRIKDGEITLRYGTTQEKSISPMVWIPGTSRVSFVLVNELFASNVNGDQLRSYATNVLGMTTQTDEGIPAALLAPVWSANSRFVAYHKEDGLYLIDTYSNQETPIETTKDKDQGKKAPFRALNFTNNSSHLLYANNLKPDGQSTFLYSIAEKKSVPVGDFGTNALVAAGRILSPSSDSTGLHRYSLETWQNDPCTQITPDFSQASLSDNGTALLSLESAQGIPTLTLTDTIACSSYDVIKATNLSSPLWLPN